MNHNFVMWSEIFCLIIISSAFGSLSAFASEADLPIVATKSKPVALVIAPEQFRDEELFVPKEILEKAGYKTLIAGPVTGKAVGMLGGTAEIAVKIEELKEPEISALIIVGGSGSPKYLWKDTTLQKLVIETAQAHKPTAAICLSPIVLARAGVLKAKHATVWKSPETSAEFESAGVIAENQHCVTDGFIVTADGPQAAKDFAEAVLALLKANPN